MNILDVIILICCIPILLDGYRKGFIRQAISIFALLIGVWVASGLGDTVGSWVYPAFKSCEQPEHMANLAGFAIVLVVVLLSIGLVGRLVEKLILIVVPRWCNTLLGIALAALQALLLLSVLFYIFQILNKIYFFTDLKSALFADSTFYPMIESFAEALLPSIQQLII
jgi:uncharacterized membrane protein required for colicin V production